MYNFKKLILLTLLFGIPAIPLGQFLWPTAVGMMTPPTQMQLVLLIIVGIIEALAFGIGAAIVIHEWRRIKKMSTVNLVSFISLIWLLASWWPHDRLHQHIGNDLGALVKLEYGFHITLIIATIILIANFLPSIIKEKV